MVQDVPFTNEEDDDTGQDYLCPRTQESTLAIYESKWRIFTAWCNIQHINPLSATESVVSDFLLHLHTEKHLAISTMAGYQMPSPTLFVPLPVRK